MAMNLLKNSYCKCSTMDTFRSLESKVTLSVFHFSIQNPNAKHRPLCQLLQCLSLEFDVVVLSEVWSSNIDFYSNIPDGCHFYYDLPDSKKAGGVRVY
jgi:hypothetical protein